uniref:Uncharacterized protein n=1 Tax=viral metagenome TaxID=1070528 RepID=A0A6C0L3W0_9ZZZZ|tara:strand:+ start:9870 stop:10751 length:882 start_codon:yes stop_codon:yes gene_type:complete
MTDKINAVFVSFIEDIIKVFPEYKERLYDTYFEGEEKNVIHDELNGFLNNVNKISEQIVENEFSIFDKDPILLTNVSFKLLWNSKNITKQNKESVWKYLQTFCMYTINLESSDKMNDVIKSIESKEKVTDKNTLQNMKKLKKLNKSMNEVDSKLEENEHSDLSQLDDMFQNTSIGKIAQEITSELDIDSMLSEDGGIEQLFNGGNMMNIMQTISGKLNDSENNQELMEEASKICGTMKDNPLFNTMMGMQSQMFNQEEVKNINVSPGKNHSASAKRIQLQKKLEERKSKNKEE